MTLDAMIMGLPVLNIAFDSVETSPRKRKYRFYRYHHWKPLLEDDVLTICQTKEDLIDGIRKSILKYPTDPRKISESMEHLCHRSKGLAVENIIQVIEKQLSN